MKSHPRRRARSSPATRPSELAEMEVPLPAKWRGSPLLEGGSIALVDVEGDRLKLHLLTPPPLDTEGSPLSAAEEETLARGGVAPVSREEVRHTHAQAAAAYHQLRATSLNVEAAAARLGVNPSRIRQRLADRTLYGFKAGAAWLLPAFQFQRQGTVPGIEQVLKRLPEGLSAVALSRWLQTANPDLTERDDAERGLTPLQWLQSGHPPETVAELAAVL